MTVILTMRYGYVYRIDVPPFGKWKNGAFYIGRHKGTKVDDGYFGSGIIIRNYIDLHGTSELVKSVLAWADSNDELNSLEVEFIRRYWGDERLLNQHTGGTHSELTDEQRRKLSASLRGKNRGPKSEETKRKISEKLTGRSTGPKSDITKMRLRVSNLGKSHKLPSEESKAKMRERRAVVKVVLRNENVRYGVMKVPSYSRPNKPHKKLSVEDCERKSKQFTGLKFYNNGKISVRARECPDGFVPGRLGIKHYEALISKQV